MDASVDLAKASGKGDVLIHLSFVENWLSCAEANYTPPHVPVTIPKYSEVNIQEFGHSCRKFFYLTDEFVFINHGALGCSLRDSLDVSQAYQRYMDSQPLRAIDREITPLLCHVTRISAAYVGCEPRDLVLIENATTGINIILNSLRLTADDTILTLSLGYGAVKLAVDAVCQRAGASHQIVDISLPLTAPHQVVDKVRDALHPAVKLAIFDHIPSNASCLLPIHDLIALCKQHNILVMLDGAHSLGQVDLNISSLDADFFVTNCHKWFSNTRGSALMYVKREHQADIHPLVVSWGKDKGFSAEFMWSGTGYYSQYVSLLATINFWRRVGADRIRQYCNSTIIQAEKMCRERWNVKPVCPSDMWASMALVELPARLNDKQWSTSGKKHRLIQDYLYFKWNIEATIRSVCDILYIRLSCHIYNELCDFEKLADAMLEVCDNRDMLDSLTF